MADYLISSFLTVVDELLSETTIQELPIAGRYRQIRSAVNSYSHDRPELYLEDESGDGGKYYEIAGATPLLSRFTDGFSRVMSIEYPAVTIASDDVPTYLNADDYNDDYRVDVSGTQTRYIFFSGVTPAATETWRIAYTALYNWTASSTTIDVEQTAHGLSVSDYIYYNGTKYVDAAEADLASHQVTVVTDADNFTAAVLQTNVPASDFDAITYKAACFVCRAISAKYSRIGDSLVSADSGAHVTKAQEFATRAKDFCASYSDLLGLAAPGGDGERDMPAGNFVEMTTAPSWQLGRRYLFHGRRR